MSQQYKVGQVVEYSDFSYWEDAEILSYDPKEDSYQVRFLSDNFEMMAVPEMMREKEE